MRKFQGALEIKTLYEGMRSHLLFELFFVQQQNSLLKIFLLLDT
jgi:hypothetical protein